MTHNLFNGKMVGKVLKGKEQLFTENRQNTRILKQLSEDCETKNASIGSNLKAIA